MKKITWGGFAIICLLFVNLLPVSLVQAVGSETPIIDFVKNTIIGTNDSYLVSGKTVKNSDVMVYVDGTFIDYADVKEDNEGRFIYKYQLNKELLVGKHKVMIIGKDKTSLVLSPPSQQIEFDFLLLPTPPAPTIIKPSNNNIFSNIRPLITGLTESDTQVSLFIDGKFITKTGVLKNNSGTANFSYRPNSDLSFGWHVLTAFATDKYDQQSPTSSKIAFKIEKPLPAPVLLKTIMVKGSNQPYITGLVKNDLAVKVFIDNKIDGSFTVKNNQSGTANFSYRIRRPLTKGQHWVYTTSVDKRGKASGQSNIIKIDVSGQNGNIIKEVKNVVKEETEPEAVIKDIATEPKKQDAPVAENEAVTKPEVKDEEPEIKNEEDKKTIEDLIKQATTTEDAKSGIVDENNGQQSKIKLNLIVFILFLMAVIAWIFWVNRELIKEKNSQTGTAPDKDQDKNKDSEKTN